MSKIQYYTPQEDQILRDTYPTKGATACQALLPHRSYRSIIQRARRLGLKYTTVCAICGQPISSGMLCHTCRAQEQSRLWKEQTAVRRQAKKDTWRQRLREDVCGDACSNILVPKDLAQAVEYVLNQLNPNQRTILLARYRDCMTLKNTGPLLGLTRERVRQIELKGLYKLRRPELRYYLLHGYAAGEQHAAEVAQEKEQQRRNLLCSLDQHITQVGNTPIDSLNLSHRSWFHLKKHGLNSVQDILRYTNGNCAKLLSIAHLGPTSVYEIMKKLQSLGIAEVYCSDPLQTV